MEREQNPLTFVTHISKTIHYVNGDVVGGPARSIISSPNQETLMKVRRTIIPVAENVTTENTLTTCEMNR
jgi:hypothetical protein